MGSSYLLIQHLVLHHVLRLLVLQTLGTGTWMKHPQWMLLLSTTRQFWKRDNSQTFTYSRGKFSHN